MTAEDVRIKYLESVQRSNEITQLMLAGAARVQKGGVPGIVSVANTHPQAILGAFEALSILIQSLQVQKLELVEDLMKMLDRIDELSKS